MKFRSLIIAAPIITIAAFSSQILAADLYWDGTDTTADADGGTGIWATGDISWDNSATGGTATAWSSNDIAFFGGTGGAVTIGDPITADGVAFNSTGYTVGGSALTLAGTTPAIATHQNATITSAIAGLNGFTKTGAGTLVLSGANTFSGTVTISAGILALDSSTAIGSGNMVSINGGTLRFSATNTSDLTAGGLLKIEDTKTAGFDTNGQNVVFASPLSLGAAKTGGIQKSGTGELRLAADNNYTGSTTINAGTLVLNKTTGAQLYKTGSFFGAQSTTYLNINAGGTFATYNWDYGANGALDQLRNNYYSISLNGGTIRMDDTFSSQRAFQIGANGGTLEVTAGNTYTKQAGNTGGENILRFGANSTLTVTGAGNAVIEDALAPASYGNTGFGIAKTGAGSLTLSGFSRYTGNTTVSGGTAKITGGIYQGSYQSGAVLTVNGGATLELNNWNYDQGGSTASLGGLRANNSAIVINGGTIRMVGTTATSYGRGLTIQSGGATFDAATGANWTLAFDAGVANVYTGNPSITLTGGGTGSFDKIINSGSGGLTKSGGGSWTLSRANTYTGNTAINGGTLNLTGIGGIYTGATKTGAASITISGGGVLVGDRWSWGSNQSLGMLNYNNGNISVNNGTIRNTAVASTDFGNRGITVGAGGITYENATSGTTFTVTGVGNGVTNTNNSTYAANAPVTLTGVGNGNYGQSISGSGVTLTKSGGGTWTLGATNTYTGSTSVNEGRLNVTGSITSGTSVAAGATLSGDGTITGNVSLAGTLLPGQGGTTDRTLNINGNVTTTAGSIMSFTVTSMTSHDKLVIESGGSIGLNNADLAVDFDNALTFTELGTGLGDDFLAQLDSFTGTGTWFKLINGTTTGMFHNVTQTMTSGELAHFGLSGTHYKTTLDGQDFWIVSGSTYLVAIPEPRAALIGGLGMLMLLRRRRHNIHPVGNPESRLGRMP